MEHTKTEAELKDRVSAIISFIPIFTHQDFIFAEEIPPSYDNGGYVVPGHYRYHPDVYSFIQVCNDASFINPKLVECLSLSDKRAREIQNNPESINHITITEATCLLTFLCRQDRFVHGFIVRAFNDGTIISILYRIEQLQRQ